MTIASISKTMTATAIVKLVEQGKVDLKAPVRTYLPDFAVQDPAATKDVAVWHLLTHTPGWEGQLSTEDRGVDALAHFVTTIMRDLPQLAPPGAVWSYNNAGFALAGRLIEVVTGRNIHDALREIVFAPLGLTRTFTRLPDVMAYRYTLGHREQNGRTTVIRHADDVEHDGGRRDDVARDLMRYAQFHLGDGAPGAARRISRGRYWPTCARRA
jgi:CubicO group peptidase (beta-lactamase class C family)